METASRSNGITFMSHIVKRNNFNFAFGETESCLISTDTKISRMYFPAIRFAIILTKFCIYKNTPIHACF